MAKPQNSTLEQVALFILVAASVGCFAFSLKAPWAWAFAVPCAVSLIWTIQRVPSRLAVWAKYAAWTALAAAVLIGLLHRAYPILSDEATRRPKLIAGLCLICFASLFLLGTKVWRPADSLIPSVLGIFLIAAFNPYAPHIHLMVALAGLSGFAYLWMSGRSFDPIGPAGRLHRMQISRLVVSALAVFLIAAAIIQVLPGLQVRVVQATNRFNGPQFNFYAGFSRDSTLGDLEELHLSPKVVMRVWTSLPQKLRGRVFSKFDGKAWHATITRQENLMPAPAAAVEAALNQDKSQNAELATWLNGIAGNSFGLPGHSNEPRPDSRTARTNVLQIVFNDGMLVSPGNKVLVRLAVPYLRVDAFENLTPPPQSSVEIYGIVNREDGGIAQGGPGNAESTAECLALPDQTDERLKVLAQRLAHGNVTAEEKVKRTLNYLQSQCHYSLKVGGFHSQQPVAEFLFEKKQGYCEYFASAAAVLLRLEGVPARYVTGFNVQAGNRQGSHYVVRESDAHAWDEVYLSGKGWVEVDATPEAEYAALHADLENGWLATSMEDLKTLWAEISARIAQGGWLATLRWMGGGLKILLGWVVTHWMSVTLPLLGLTVAGIFLRVRRKKVSRHAPPHNDPLPETGTTPPELAELLREMDSLLAREGFLRPASRAPLEHLGSIPPGKIPSALRESSRRIIESFYQASFGGAAFTASEARELRRALEQWNSNRHS